MGGARGGCSIIIKRVWVGKGLWLYIPLEAVAHDGGGAKCYVDLRTAHMEL